MVATELRVKADPRAFELALGARPMKICLVRPPTLTSVGAVGQDAVPPLGLAYIAAALAAAGHRVMAVDAVGEAAYQYSRIEAAPRALVHGLLAEEIVARIPTDVDVIGVSCMFSVEWLVARNVLIGIRRSFPNALIVIGGEHVTACPEYSLATCDAVDVGVLGEGEATIVDLINAYSAGKNFGEVRGIVYREGGAISTTEHRPRVRDVDNIPQPDWEIFPVEAYIDNALTHGANLGRCMPILASRGCPYQCTFCSNPQMWGTIWLARKPERVIDEMKQYIARYRVTNFDFYDLTAIVKKDWIVEFANLLIREKLNITWQLPSGTRSEALDDEVTQLLYRSGCRIINYAPESGSPSELDRIKKRVKPARMLTSMRGAYRAGLQIKANFIFGMPGSSWADVAQTFRFIARMAWVGVHDMNAFPFSPYPGSQLFEELRQAGRVSMNDEYFRTLLAYTDPAHSVSYADFIGSRALSALNICAMLYFYSLSFLFRPWRAVKLGRALLTRDSSTKLTMALANAARKQAAMRLLDETGEGIVKVPLAYTPRSA